MFGALLRFCMTRLGLPAGTANVESSDEVTKERIDFLDRDFETKAFARAKSVTSATILPTDERILHFGALAASFESCDDLRLAEQAVRRAKRTNFRLPILTVFVALARERELMLVFSETPLRPDIQGMLDDVPSFAPDRAACIDRR